MVACHKYDLKPTRVRDAHGFVHVRRSSSGRQTGHRIGGWFDSTRQLCRAAQALRLRARSKRSPDEPAHPESPQPPAPDCASLHPATAYTHLTPRRQTNVPSIIARSRRRHARHDRAVLLPHALRSRLGLSCRRPARYAVATRRRATLQDRQQGARPPWRCLWRSSTGRSIR